METLIECVRKGVVVELFAVYKFADGEYESMYDTGDMDDMCFQVRTEMIRAQCSADAYTH
jgi:hypothetical protein